MPKFQHMSNEMFHLLLQRARLWTKHGIGVAYPKSSPLGVSVYQIAEALTACQELQTTCTTLRANLEQAKESARNKSVVLRRRNAELTEKLAESKESTRIARQKAKRLFEQLDACRTTTKARALRRCILGAIRRFHPDKISSTTPEDVTAELNEMLSIMQDGQSSDDAENCA